MPVAKKPVLKDIAFTLKTGTTPYKVVSVLQEQFKSPEKKNADGTVVAPRKAQGRLLIDAMIEALCVYASAETLAALADDVKDKGVGDKKGKASEYIAAIISARPTATSSSSGGVDVKKMNAEQRARLRQEIEEADKAEAEATKAGKGTKEVAPV